MAKVLIVDDDEEIRKMLQNVVAQEGHDALLAADVPSAEVLLEQKPDLLLLDIDMPGETGIELALTARRRPELNDAPVVFVTAFPERARPLQATGRGAMRIIEKPFHISEIRELLQTVLGASGGTEWISDASRLRRRKARKS